MFFVQKLNSKISFYNNRKFKNCNNQISFLDDLYFHLSVKCWFQNQRLQRCTSNVKIIEFKSMGYYFILNTWNKGSLIFTDIISEKTRPFNYCFTIDLILHLIILSHTIISIVVNHWDVSLWECLHKTSSNAPDI